MVNLAAGSTTGIMAGAANSLTGIENRWQSYDDILIGDNNANVIDGLAGDDTLQGGGGGDLCLR